MMSCCNTANGHLFVVREIHNTVRLLWTLYALHRFNPKIILQMSERKPICIKATVPVFFFFLQSTRIIQSVSDSDSCKNTKGCLNQNTIQWGNGFKNAGYTLLKTHLRHRSENKEVALLIRSRDAPVLSCHIHEKFPAQHITLSTFFILFFPYHAFTHKMIMWTICMDSTGQTVVHPMMEAKPSELL